jgi:hypothetical protein
MVLFAYLAKVACFLERGQTGTARRARLFEVHPFLTFANSLMCVALLRESLLVDVLSMQFERNLRLVQEKSRDHPCFDDRLGT